MDLIVIIGFSVLITWAIIKKRFGILKWLGVCFSPSLIVYFLLFSQFAFKGEDFIIGMILLANCFVGGLIVFVLGLLIYLLRQTSK